jgi:hypothetical protein
MAYVQLDGTGAVTGIYGGPQVGNPAVSLVDDNDPRIAAWQAAQNPAKPQTLTPAQFLNRFPPAVIGALAANPATLPLLINLAAASVIVLSDPAVQGGINSVVPAFLTAAQAATILDH